MRQAKRWAVAAAVAAALLVVYNATAGTQNDTPTIKDIMVKAHKGNTSLVSTIGRQLQMPKPDWDAISDEAKSLAELGVALGKNKPPKGTQESWDLLTKKYNDTTQMLVTATADKDKNKSLMAQRVLAQSCMGCHSRHKGR